MLILGVDAYTVTIQGTVDLYHLSDDLHTFTIDYYPYHLSDISKDSAGATLTVHGPNATATYSLLAGDFEHSYLRDFYYRIHIDPTSIELGNVVTDQSYPINIWNAWFVTKDLSDVTEIDLTAAQLTLPFAPPYTFTPLQNVVGEISIVSTGASIIDGYYIFNFGYITINVLIIGNRATLWPFAPQTTFNETREWLTDVIPARLGEDRLTLREVPRMSLSYNFIFRSMYEYALAKEIAHTSTNSPIATPLWSDIAQTVNVLAGASILFVETANLEFTTNGLLVIWQSFTNYEIREIFEILPTQITLKKPLINGYASCWIIPVLVGIADAIQLTRSENHKLTGTLSNKIDNSFNVPLWPNTELYKTLPVIPVNSVVTGGLELTITRNQDTFDSMLGRYDTIDKELYNRSTESISVAANNQTELFTMRRMYDFLAGKYKAFWLPSFNEDAIVVQNIVVANTYIKVTSVYWNTEIKEIRVTGNGGIKYYFTIASTVLDVDNTELLMLSVPSAVTINNITLLEILTKVRLNADRVEFNHSLKHPYDTSICLVRSKTPTIEVLA